MYKVQLSDTVFVLAISDSTIFQCNNTMTKQPKYTKRADFPKILKSGLNAYCFVCHKKQPKRQTRCDICGIDSKRALVWDDSIKQYFNDEEHLVHESAGAFVVNHAGMVLFIELNKFPFGYTIPAGHVDLGESSADACIREFKEEVGLEIKNLEMVYEGEIMGDSCSRGADIHRWTFYVATANNENVTLNEESTSFDWLDIHVLPNNVAYPIAFSLKQEGVIEKIDKLTLI